MARLNKSAQLNLSDTNIAGLGTELEKQVRLNAARTEEAWKGVGQTPGTKIWRIEKFHIAAWPESSYGSFYSGDSYIVLHTYKKPDTPALFHNVHFWLGLQTTQDEAGTAAYKTVELDDFLHGTPVQFREVQGSETPLFCSYFKHVHVMEGGVESGFNHVKPTEYVPRLLQIKGNKNNISIHEVPRTFKSMNSGDIFIADAGLKIYQWNGSSANGHEKSRAMEFARALAGERKTAKVEVFDEGDHDAEPFWTTIGGKGPISSAQDSTTDSAVSREDRKLFRVSDSTGPLRTTLVSTAVIKMDMFKPDDIFIFDAVSQIFTWIGTKASKEEKRMGLQIALEYLASTGRSLTLPISRVVEGGEGQTFKSMLDQ
ncbi:hypothetical protein BATDEDRAFT_37025 [Batrachochytrium dendrobatidis JAM81]|uniref:Gelsolin-like domain-containing protein n=2 Tax=Batrachochytrium dendrobatidis TaxID=109871 RepID=F4P4F3_BATDJ|nr:uncharacterized protein BATDEDRAFT_37025 [Batrachochytrium dendrobatidis JAM81]EGF79911.1 hypothetical protein BATDEDRAFT_37025 [Batrachochytrium dendrobatidis JAM81]KAJ8323349.1 hypothetical protein O5D80_008103 [Batrachochytrium dendrobatidis]KAK5673054.1 hypothetical protein QVD99_000525 [Batrachochytrium dendrobatidis]OAJ38809.1 hypothetical protein BDEG_22713 [Batrachochytrium dendrobatidis JEL423]|eukprot:XP_006679594.1 hypothetical protein BATDEDRAFT_37025 [Batrachochytrium dendrobatidis JAM81]